MYDTSCPVVDPVSIVCRVQDLYITGTDPTLEGFRWIVQIVRLPPGNIRQTLQICPEISTPSGDR